MDLSIFENLGAEIIAFLASANIITTGIVIVREIGISALRKTLNKKEIEINELNNTIIKQDGQILEMRKSQAAIVEGIGVLGAMFNKAFQNSNMKDDPKTEIAILYGQLDPLIKAAAVIGVDAVMDKVKEGADAIVEQLPEGAAQEVAGALIDTVIEGAEDLVSQVPEYLKDVVTGNDE